METYHPPKEVEEKKDNSDLPEKEVLSEKWLLEKIDSLIPLIKEKWPTIAQQTLEATKGNGTDSKFFTKWGYNDEQINAISESIYEVAT